MLLTRFLIGFGADRALNRRKPADISDWLSFSTSQLVSGCHDGIVTTVPLAFGGVFVARQDIVSSQQLSFCSFGVYFCLNPASGPATGGTVVHLTSNDLSCGLQLSNLRCEFGGTCRSGQPTNKSVEIQIDRSGSRKRTCCYLVVWYTKWSCLTDCRLRLRLRIAACACQGTIRTFVCCRPLVWSRRTVSFSQTCPLNNCVTSPSGEECKENRMRKGSEGRKWRKKEEKRKKKERKERKEKERQRKRKTKKKQNTFACLLDKYCGLITTI